MLLLAASGCVASGPTFRPERLPSAIWWNFRTCSPECVARAEWIVRIDPSQKPKQITIGVYGGIYEIADGEIRIAYSFGADRPEQLKPGPGVTFTVLRRADAPDKK